MLISTLEITVAPAKFSKMTSGLKGSADHVLTSSGSILLLPPVHNSLHLRIYTSAV